MASPPGHSLASTDDESFVLVPNPVRRASTSTTARLPAPVEQDDPASPAPMPDSMHGTGPVHGTAHVPDAAPPPVPNRHRDTAAPIAHPVAVTCDEGHSHMMVTQQATGVTLKLTD
jgi:hypothetical protein